MKVSKAHFRGCIMGGAIGDAMGYGREFMGPEEIAEKYGESADDLQRDPESGVALISDVTQQTSFTVDGLVWADARAKNKGIYAYIPCLFYSYQKWLYTQIGRLADEKYAFILNGEILRWDELYARRGPGKTCIEALAGSINGKYGTMRNRINNSKGCGGVMRAAPIGMYFWNDPKMAFRIGCESGAITHGHSCAFMSAGFLACLIALILQGKPLETAVEEALAELKRHKNGQETYDAMQKAVALSREEGDPQEQMASLGKGVVGEEAMAIALYCALKHPKDFQKAVTMSTCHGGNTSVSGGICGNILGAYLGSLEIPFKWLRNIELSDLFIVGADRLLAAVGPETGEEVEEV